MSLSRYSFSSALSVLLLFGLPSSARASASEELFGDRSRTVEWKRPLVYTASGLGMQWVALVASGEADDSPSWSNFKGAWKSGPERDDDSPVYNLVLHPLWGSETYLRAREANMGIAGSFGFSMGASITWEYLFESWTEHPSSQDLLLTTGIGWMIGELRYRVKQMLGEDRDWLVDPIHEGLEHVGLLVDEDLRPRVTVFATF